MIDSGLLPLHAAADQIFVRKFCFQELKKKIKIPAIVDFSSQKILIQQKGIRPESDEFLASRPLGWLSVVGFVVLL